MDDLGVASRCCKHECSLVGFVQGRRRVLMPGSYEDLAYLEMTETSGKMQVGVRESSWRGIGVVKEPRMGFEYALDEEPIVRVNRPTKTQRWLNPAIGSVGT